MTQITFSTETDCRSKTVEDCCVGTGRMLLHASNYSLRLYGQDIDALCVKITKINGALFAPWLAFPLPEEIFGRPQREIIPQPAEETAAAPPPMFRIEEMIKPPQNKSRRRTYRTNEAQGLLFDLD